MAIQLAALLALIGAAALPASATGPPSDALPPICIAENDTAPAQAKDCCKTCRKGKACGDTCISRDKKCTKPPGCACDAE